MSHKIHIVGGPEKGRVFSLVDGNTLVIGRGQQSDTKINDPFISRIHCKVSLSGAAVTLLDAGGGNTLVGGTPVQEKGLEPGDEFQAGNSIFRYAIGEMDPETIKLPPGSLAAASTQPKPKPTALKDLVGQSMAHYRLDKIITAGSTGFLFKATDTEKNRTAAVKVLSPDRTSTEEEKERFVRAMKTMLPIRHPNIVSLWNAGKSGPFCWAAMEYIDCESMTEVIHRIGIEGMLDWRDVWRVGVDIGRALEKAYAEKVIHRNVTPANILRRKADKACLLGDLMLAKALEGALAKQVTTPGQLLGELPYLPPERTRDQSVVDTRSDIYGLGATMYALLAGKAPFESDSTAELIRMIRDDVPKSPKKYQLAVNDLFAAIVLKMIAKRPDDRYDNPTQMLAELERVGNYQGLSMPS